MPRPDPAALRRRRARAQLLHRPDGLTAAAAVRHLLAVQAQDARSARLALRARLGAAPADTADLVVTWLMRGTLHLVHRQDLPWLHAVTAPTRLTASDRRLRRLGVDAADAVARVRAALPFTRAGAGAALGLTGQAVPHALHRAALEGHCVAGLDGSFTAWSAPAVDREQALDELARRYAVAHPGATREDLAAWAGIARRDARPLPEPPRPPGAGAPVPPRLLPAFDPYLLGWRDRGFAVPDGLRERVFPGGGMFRATAVDDGLVAGTWTVPGGRVVLDLRDGGDPGRFAAEAAAVEAALAS